MDPLDQSSDIVRLLGKYLEGTLNAQEAAQLRVWANRHEGNQALLERLTEEDTFIGDLQLYWELWNDQDASVREERIVSKVKRPVTSQARSALPRKVAAYAAVVVCVFGLFFLFQPVDLFKQDTPEVLNASEILPGGNRATLSLADGRTIDLNADRSGIVVGKDITYLDGSHLVGVASETQAGTAQMLVLKTPMGGNYQVVLPDSTKVWLNANSTLSYPDHFSEDERVVQLEGEAYFEVKSQWKAGKKIPFNVQSKGQVIHVLGTKFNVSAYPDEARTRTTLLSGSVEVYNQQNHAVSRMIPGQQAVLVGSRITINEVDVSKSIAWKEGRFSFDGKPFEQIMREMARWYNLEVAYEGAIPKDQFLGDAFKTDKLGTVLRFLESSDIQYHVESGKHHNYRLIIHDTAKGREAER